ncbi:FAD-dependent oxidoreductase [Shewanella violacea]|uniref:FAD-dependent glycerol-3-phosphate dehydrogenase family n=1 Tax=Shewanella violacea (strain JCM 10179 / CIP 106290 / LMG 19151 / DSS12) TaxID=637905 RepID=D4ZC02_SHEVD|nr:FAD-dependent oxidoreductase [Shewanella violacea]BAJ03547.1 FAD-dependent glycerol-3-phosphate dehydrogenase family [Shewanella violacea DSS12]
MDTIDLVIIGGGINGAGIAQCASAAGYSVLLLEKGAIGGQTSANSSKLIHGGLRYLETGQISLVRNSLSERRALLRLAPHLVKAVPFYIPVYDTSQRNQWAIRAGLTAYSVLSELDPLGRFTSLPAVEWSNIAGLKLQGLKAVFRYWDAQTDDKALTQAVMRSAQNLGAQVLTHAECDAIVHTPDYCDVSYLHQDNLVIQRASCVINAAGPWVNDVIDSLAPPMAKESVDLVQGSHLLLDIPALEGILYLESCFDNRVVFVMPWKGKTLLGTTETLLQELDGKPESTREEIYYLLGIYKHYFPALGSVEQLEGLIIDTFCGVRVLPKRDGSSFHRPREILLKTSVTHPRLMTLYGGKLTTYRTTSKEVVQWVESKLGKRMSIADLDTLAIL